MRALSALRVAAVLATLAAPVAAQDFPAIFGESDRIFATNCLNAIVRGGIELKGQRILGTSYNCVPLRGERQADGSYQFTGRIAHQLDFRPDDQLHFWFRIEPDLTFVPYVLTGDPGINGVSSATLRLQWESGGVFAFPSALLNSLQDAFRFSTPLAGPDLDNQIFAPQWAEWDDWEFVTAWLAYGAIAMKAEQMRSERCYDHRTEAYIACGDAPAGPATPGGGDQPRPQTTVPATPATGSQPGAQSNGSGMVWDESCGCWQRPRAQ